MKEDQIPILLGYYPEHLKEDIKKIYEALNHELFHAKIYSIFKAKSKITIDIGQKELMVYAQQSLLKTTFGLYSFSGYFYVRFSN